MSKSPNPDIINKIYFRNIYSCQRKIYWYKVKVMETINAVWEHSYGEDCIPNFSANMEQPRHRWYEFKEGFSLTLVERAIRETKKDNKSTSFTVLDPFSGSGTSPLTALQSRCNAIGYEVISKSGILGWRSKYIEVVFDSLLTKSFPRVVRAVQNEPGISLLESINRTSTLLESSLINALYEDFGVLKEIIGDPQIDLVVPASLWIDYLSVQKQ